MASDDEVIINLEEDSASEPLMFRDYHDDVSDHVTGELTVEQEGASDDSQKETKTEGEGGSVFSLLTISYYQKMFDVTTSQVLSRMLWSMIPTKKRYLEVLQPNADLYGPFWVPMTLLFCIAIAGNLTKFLTQSENAIWEFHFDEVTFMAGVIYSYTWLVPIILWAVLSWQQLAVATILEIIAIYGYSLTIYIPICVLWLIPIPWLQWLLVAVGVAMSGLVMLLALRPTSQLSVKTQFGNIVMIIMVLLHVALGVGFKIYYIHSGFFYDVNSDNTSTTHLTTTATSATTVNNSNVPMLK